MSKMAIYDDAYYIKRVLAGETDCFACLVDRYGRAVFSLIVKIIGSREDAEELCQDVFVKVFRSLSSFKGNSSFSTWAYRIAYNTAISQTRYRKTEFLSIEEEQIANVSEEEVAEVFGRSGNEEMLIRLDEAMEKLSHEERALILLFYMQEKTVEDVAVISGLSASNVKTRLHRIRKKLFVLLKNERE